MSEFKPNRGIVGQADEWETPEFIKNFWEWITGEPEAPKPKFNNPFK